MASYGVAEARNRLTALIAAAERGEAVTITRHGRPVVEIRPVTTAATPGRPRPMDAKDLQQLLDSIAGLNLPERAVDGARLVDEMREADLDPDLAGKW